MIHKKPLKLIHFNHWKDKHAGEEIYVIGRGPSLLNFAPKFLASQICICVNTSIYYLMGYKRKRTYRIIMDAAAVRGYLTSNPRYKRAPRNVPNVHTFISQNAFDAMTVQDIEFMKGASWTIYRHKWPGQFSRPVDGEGALLWRPTMFAAISEAIYMGATTVHMVGMNLYVPKGEQTHFDQDVLNKDETKRILYENNRMLIENVVPICEKMGVKIRRWAAPFEELPVDSGPR